MNDAFAPMPDKSKGITPNQYRKQIKEAEAYLFGSLFEEEFRSFLWGRASNPIAKKSFLEYVCGVSLDC